MKMADFNHGGCSIIAPVLDAADYPSPYPLGRNRVILEKGLPAEGCGLLAGRAMVVMEVHPVANSLKSETAFRMDPKEQVRLLLDFEKRGLDLTGIFHSHPHGPSFPSAIDVRQASYPGVIQLICWPDGMDWKCRAYRIPAAGEPDEIDVKRVE